MSTIQDWFMAKGDETLRVNYPLTEDSIVFDVGGYEGTFVDKIYAKYGCRIFVFEPVVSYYNKLVSKFASNSKITIINKAISNINGKQQLSVNTDKSGFYGGGETVEVDCTTLDTAMFNLKVRKIDLLKLNIEGAEYVVLEDMIEKGLIEKCENIQVQFHTIIPDYKAKHAAIQNILMQTHSLTYYYPFVWENYKNMTGSLSQAGQDLFVLSQFPKGYKGSFLDVGCNLPDKINNTLLLEQKGWTGTSLDIKDYSSQWKVRKTNFVCADALTYTYPKVNRLVDYLSLDIEGTGFRFLALQHLVDLGFMFKVITIEHDAYRNLDKEERQPQRNLLNKLGYKLVMPNVHHNGKPFEDWWIHPEYIKIK